MFAAKVVMLLVWICHVDLGSSQLTSESKSTHCSYTFNVPRDEHNNGFCPSDNKTFYDDGGLSKSQVASLISNQQEQLRLLTASLLDIKETQLQLKETQADMKETQVEVENRLDRIDSGTTTQSPTTQIGVNYIRWGRTVCPDTAVKLYVGYAAKSKCNHSGGGVNYICLHSNPEVPHGATSGFQHHSRISGVEYEMIFQHLGLYESDAPCAACIVHGRSQQIMIPGRLTCGEGWTKEYSGIMASDRENHKKASYVCLDSNPEKMSGTSANVNGGLFYSVEIECAYSAFCPPYEDGYELSCVVCTM